jgi:hypothetical protein
MRLAPDDRQCIKYSTQRSTLTVARTAAAVYTTIMGLQQVSAVPLTCARPEMRYFRRVLGGRKF